MAREKKRWLFIANWGETPGGDRLSQASGYDSAVTRLIGVLGDRIVRVEVNVRAVAGHEGQSKDLHLEVVED